MEVDPIISEHMRKLNALRKNKVGGFKSPKTQKKIAKIKAKKNELGS